MLLTSPKPLIPDKQEPFKVSSLNGSILPEKEPYRNERHKETAPPVSRFPA